jgi:hypothetical protein
MLYFCACCYNRYHGDAIRDNIYVFSVPSFLTGSLHPLSYILQLLQCIVIPFDDTNVMIREVTKYLELMLD